jgi:hypothetical protein
MTSACTRTAAAALALLVVGAASCAKTSGTSPGPPPEEPPATARDGAPVFAVPVDAEAAIGKAGLRVLNGDEPPEQYLRAHLDVFIEGRVVTVPRGIGVVDEKRSSPLVTRDDSGVLHISSTRKETFRLGQLFQQWNVPLDKDCIAGFCASANPDRKQLLAFVNGELAADPSTIHLTDGIEIVVWYGNRDINPPVPTTYGRTAAAPPSRRAGSPGRRSAAARPPRRRGAGRPGRCRDPARARSCRW